MDIHPDILIYLQTVKNFFENNKEARTYFYVEYDMERFFNMVIDFSKKNLKEINDPKLTMEQFESIRNNIMELFSDTTNMFPYIQDLKLSYQELSKINLN